MRKIIIYTFLLLVSVAAKASESPEAHWEAGNEAYSAKNYTKAVKEYRAILDGGEYSAELYYNLGNAYYKMDSLGKAILYYNRALRMEPSHEDALHNLSMAEERIQDKVVEEPEFFLNSWMRSLRNVMSCTVWSVLSMVMFGLLLVCLLLFLLSSSIKVRKIGFFGAMSALLLFVATTAFAVSSRNDMLLHDKAIILASAISVKSSPEQSATELFIMHEGTKVRIVSEHNGWVEIALADGKKGWTEKRNLEEI